MIYEADLLRNDVLAKDVIRPEMRLDPHAYALVGKLRAEDQQRIEDAIQFLESKGIKVIRPCS